MLAKKKKVGSKTAMSAPATPGDYQFQQIKSVRIGIDHTYQRPVQSRLVSEIAGAFSWSAFSTITVGKRGDGTLWAVDGQQRLTAAKQLSIDVVPCSVFHSRGPEHEAAEFVRMNGQQRRVTTDQRFRGELAAGDRFALALKSAVALSGFELVPCGPSSRYAITKVTPLIDMTKRRGGGMGLVTRTLSLIREAWDGDARSKESNILDGVGYFIRCNPDADDARVLEVIKRLGCDGLRNHAALARGFVGGQGARTIGVALSIETEYNKRLGPSRRLNGVASTFADASANDGDKA